MPQQLPSQSLATWLDQLAPATADEPAAQATPGPVENGPVENGPVANAPVEERLLLSVARPAMACEFEVLLNQHQYPQGPERALAALDLIEHLELKLSVYKLHSDLSLLNRFGAQRPITVCSDTLRLVQLACDLHQLTGGAFDLTAGSLSEAWGFSRRQGALPTPEQIADALQVVGSHWIDIDAHSSQVALRKAGVKTNPGGIGKGYALDRAAAHLWDEGVKDFLIHGGLSSVIARGNRQHPHVGGGWLVSLRHPLRMEQVLGTIRLRNQALGTSGSGKQFFHFGGRRYSHIIDPRSGWPAQGLLSATVICASGAVADALATALFVMGRERAVEFCAAYPQISAILLEQESPSGRLRIEAINVPEGQWSTADARLVD